MFLLAVTAFSLWHYLFFLKGQEKTQTYALDVGKGDMEYVRAGNAVVLLGSAPMGALPAALQKQNLSPKEIGVLVITGTTASAYGGFIDILQNYNVGAVIIPDFSSTAKTYAKLQELISEKYIPEILVRDFVRIGMEGKDYFLYTVSCPTPAKVSIKYACTIVDHIAKDQKQ